MARQKALVIGRPFDARHVSGVGIPGTATPMNSNIPRSMTTGSELQSNPPPPPPLPTFTHTKLSVEDLEKMMPKRANTVHSHDERSPRPGLRLQRSFSRLTRSVSRSGSRSAIGHRDDSDSEDESIRQKPKEVKNRFSISRSRSFSSLVRRSNFGYGVLNPYHRDYADESSTPSVPTQPPILPVQRFDRKASEGYATNTNVVGKGYHYPSASMATTVSTSILSTHTTPPQMPAYPASSSYQYLSTSTNSNSYSSTSSPSSHHSATSTERPLGFREIMAVQSFSERMALYKRTREYWARADHGLGEWVGKARFGGSGMTVQHGEGVMV